MAKLPAIQFYPADWRKDPAVQSLSFHDRGIWFEILCLMHESEQRGKLLLNGKPMPEDALARLLGLDKQNLTKTLNTLIEYGVASRDEDGVLFNRRMVRDEKLREIRKKAGSLGGNPFLVNQNPNQKPSKTKKQVNQKPTPSSSASAYSVSKETGESSPGGESEERAQALEEPPRQLTVWDWGWRVLTDLPEGKARNLLGGQLKKFAEEEVIAALRRVEKEKPAAPSAFFCGVLQAKPKNPMDRGMQV